MAVHLAPECGAGACEPHCALVWRHILRSNRQHNRPVLYCCWSRADWRIGELASVAILRAARDFAPVKVTQDGARRHRECAQRCGPLGGTNRWQQCGHSRWRPHSGCAPVGPARSQTRYKIKFTLAADCVRANTCAAHCTLAARRQTLERLFRKQEVQRHCQWPARRLQVSSLRAAFPCARRQVCWRERQVGARRVSSRH